MGMANDPSMPTVHVAQREPVRRAFVKATFPLERAGEGDDELNCLHCGGLKCEYVIVIRGQGRFTGTGIHERCVARYGVEGTP